uniref:Uncharacterized protein n=1 Tax=Caenorhabditis japonica TaxID=281687 RepID=A0A8R1ILK6_CAEJA
MQTRSTENVLAHWTAGKAFLRNLFAKIIVFWVRQNSSATNTSPILLGNLDMGCKRFRLNLSMKHRIRWIIFVLTWLQLGSVMNCVDVFSFSMVYMEKNATIAAEAGKDDVGFI